MPPARKIERDGLRVYLKHPEESQHWKLSCTLIDQGISVKSQLFPLSEGDLCWHPKNHPWRLTWLCWTRSLENSSTVKPLESLLHTHHGSKRSPKLPNSVCHLMHHKREENSFSKRAAWPALQLTSLQSHKGRELFFSPSVDILSHRVDYKVLNPI